MCNVPEGTVTAEAAPVRVASSPPFLPKEFHEWLLPMRVQTGTLFAPLRRQETFLPDVSGKSTDYITSTEWQGCESVQTQKPDDHIVEPDKRLDANSLLAATAEAGRRRCCEASSVPVSAVIIPQLLP